MSPAELPPAQQPLEEDPDSHGTGTRVKWTLTKEALDRLLERFSPDHQEAERQYLIMRAKLLRFFEWRSSPSPDKQVDDTVDRVARKMDEGTTIINLEGYFRTARHYIYLESLESEELVALDDIPERADQSPAADEQKETRLRCLDECLEKLSLEARQLILNYYVDTKRAKINHRLQLAEKSTINAVRIRACRIRKDLEKCVKNCVSKAA